jgi:hypothetical protein
MIEVVDAAADGERFRGSASAALEQALVFVLVQHVKVFICANMLKAFRVATKNRNLTNMLKAFRVATKNRNLTNMLKAFRVATKNRNLMQNETCREKESRLSSLAREYRYCTVISKVCTEC